MVLLSRSPMIVGHTDSLGSEGYNLSLSQRRAMTLANYIIEKYRIPAQKVKAIGRGELEPVATNENFQGRRKNRRVVIEILLN
ncbi:MAG: OmpA family protein [Oligoflexales bacterium]|nr:OmpA family protein [Oligoflexales bacterium]